MSGVGWITDTITALRGFDIDEFVIAELPDVVEVLDSLCRAAETARAQALARLDASGFTETDVGQKTPAWMSNRLHRPRRKCQAAVKTARAMTNLFPILGDAIRTDSPFTLEHLETLLRVCNPRNQDAFQQIQPSLIDIAGCTSFTEYEHHIRRLGHQLDQDGPFDPDTERERSRLNWRYTPDGIRLNGELVGSMAGTVAEALVACHGSWQSGW